MKQKVLSLFLAACMTAALVAGCGSTKNTANMENGGTEGSTVSNSTESSTQTADTAASESGDYTRAGGEGEIVVGIISDPENMGPWAGMSQGRIAILNTVYEYLITRENGETKGVLAKNWTQIDDTTYEVELYDYIHDTEGNPITASDIKFCFDSALATKNYSKLEVIDSVTVLDDYKVEFKFSKALAVGELENVFLECAIVSQAAYEASGDQMAVDPVGTTAYKVESYTPGSQLVLVNSNDYWQTDDSLVWTTSKHNADKITMSVITEASQHTIAMQTHTVDIANGVPDTDVPKFDEGGEYADGNEVEVLLDNLTYDILYNMSADSVFAEDENLRKAIAYAIDREGLNTGAFNGNGAAVKDFGNATYPDYNKEWDGEDYFDYNIDTAKDYLAKSSYNGQSLRLMYTTSTTADMIAQMVQAYLGNIGVTVELVPYEQMSFIASQFDSAAYDIMLRTTGSTDYIVNQWKLCWYSPDFESTTGGTANFVKDSKLDELMAACLNVKTYGEESIAAFHDYLVEKCYGYGIVEGTINSVHSKYITKVALDDRNQILPGACELAE